jgi:YD repeat-containing protein
MRACRALLLFAALLAWSSAAAQTPIQYMYDELGRLIAVVDPNSDTAVYEYDAVGNVLSIDRYDSADVSIISFSPNQGTVATTVTIHGTGFSTTPASNAVTFNGTAATVSSATSTKLVVTVPVGATTGAIAVTAPGGSDTGAESFTVMAGSLTPTITSFTPTIGVGGTSVSVTGTNFHAVPAHSKTRFNATLAAVSAATTTTITTSVPTLTGSGRVTVTTPDGSVTSTDDFIVPPSPYGATDVAASGRLAFATPTSVTVSTANKIGLVLFDGTAGQRVSLLLSSLAITRSHVSIYQPNLSALYESGAIYAASGSVFIDVQTLPFTGTYTILLDPDLTYTGSLTMTLFDVPADIVGTLVPDGSSATFSVTTAGQNARYTFAGVADDRVAVHATNATIPNSAVRIRKPDGTVLVSTSIGANGAIDATVLPTTGTYAVEVDPSGTGTGNMTLALYDVEPDVTDTTTTDGTPVTITTTDSWQNAYVTFDAPSGEQVTVTSSNGSYGGCNLQGFVFAPNGSSIYGVFCAGTSDFRDAKLLTSTGTYTIKLDPQLLSTGSVTVAVSTVTDVTGTITAGGSAVGVTTTAAGQNVLLTFSGTAGQRVSLRATSTTIGGSSTMKILRPDGTTLGTTTITSGGTNFLDTKTLSATGTHTVVVDPSSTNTGSTTLTLYNVPADASASVSIGGSVQTLTTTVPGQNAQATFSGTSSQQVTVRVTNNTMGTTTVKLLKPDGSQLTTTTSSSSSFNLATQTLPTTGTYTISIDPSSVNVGSIGINVTNP